MGVKIRQINGKWYVKIDYHGIRICRMIGKDLARAQQVAHRLEEALELHGFDAIDAFKRSRKPRKQIPTVRVYVQKWAESLEASGLEESTADGYRSILKRRIVPELGDRRLDELDYAVLKTWITSVAREFSRDTVRIALAVLSTMLSEAVREGIIKANPVLRSGLTKFYRTVRRIHEEIDPFSLDELDRIEATFRERFPEFVSLFLTLSRTGIRIGEALGLQWRDIDWEAGEIIVRRAVTQKGRVKKPKNPTSTRRVDMISRLADELRQWRLQCEKRAFQRGAQLGPEAWIWSQDGRPIRYHWFDLSVWHRVLRLAKIRHRRIHDIRHTWASQMLKAGADVAWVARQMGHANASTLLQVYTHWIPGSKRVTAEIFDGQADANTSHTKGRFGG